MAVPPLDAFVLNERILARLRLRHLRLIAALEQCTTLGDAARQVGVTQPAASQILREVEALIEMPLFERHARGLRATEAGLVLARQAHRVLGGVRQAAESLASLAQGRPSPLNIGAIPAAVIGLVRPRLELLRTRLPSLEVLIEEAGPADVMSKLRAGTVQLALIRSAHIPVALASWAFTELLADELVAVASPHHKAARLPTVDLAELAGASWILPPDGRPSATAFAAACEAAGFAPRRAQVQTLSSDLLPMIVGDHKTLAALPRSIASAMLAVGTVVALPLRERIALTPIGALYQSTDRKKDIATVVEVLQPEYSGR